MDANAGNFYLAEKEFDETIEAFNALGFPVRTVCPHGTR
ncbi:hypothetical protein JCM19238_3259 [Vibrio ponticus]|nr:hypothetical protein JCM19238_3259 [Vibrio ponticus]